MKEDPGPYMPFTKEEGTPYRPSNGTEREYFQRRHCYRCKYFTEGEEGVRYCEYSILTRTMIYSIEEDEYPNEWQWGEDGDPTCTKFKPRRD